MPLGTRARPPCSLAYADTLSPRRSRLGCPLPRTSFPPRSLPAACIGATRATGAEALRVRRRGVYTRSAANLRQHTSCYDRAPCCARRGHACPWAGRHVRLWHAVPPPHGRSSCLGGVWVSGVTPWTPSQSISCVDLGSRGKWGGTP